MKKFSLIVPIHNEEKILEEEIKRLTENLQSIFSKENYEILLIENGSWDKTLNLAFSLAKHYPQIRVITLNTASYGKALKKGILESKGEYLVLFNIDLWDIDFLKKALEVCQNGYDIVVGSKTMKGAKDLRPFFRRILTRSFNGVLKYAFGFRGTDTHGMKVLKRKTILPIDKQCRTAGEIFDTELLLRAQYHGLRITEIPTVCREKRKSTYGLLKRIPRTIRDLFLLYKIRNML